MCVAGRGPQGGAPRPPLQSPPQGQEDKEKADRGVGLRQQGPPSLPGRPGLRELTGPEQRPNRALSLRLPPCPTGCVRQREPSSCAGGKDAKLLALPSPVLLRKLGAGWGSPELGGRRPRSTRALSPPGPQALCEGAHGGPA